MLWDKFQKIFLNFENWFCFWIVAMFEILIGGSFSFGSLTPFFAYILPGEHKILLYYFQKHK